MKLPIFDTDDYWNHMGHKYSCPKLGDDLDIESCTCGPLPRDHVHNFNAGNECHYCGEVRDGDEIVFPGIIDVSQVEPGDKVRIERSFGGWADEDVSIVDATVISTTPPNITISIFGSHQTIRIGSAFTLRLLTPYDDSGELKRSYWRAWIRGHQFPDSYVDEVVLKMTNTDIVVLPEKLPDEVLKCAEAKLSEMSIHRNVILVVWPELRAALLDPHHWTVRTLPRPDDDDEDDLS